ncbi:bifunctional phosphoribosylaminoimidazole carboxylase/phosphoribosylaminoimidazole succinocarboxamide synthetase [Lathamus discolor]|uniref:bifunctional phosphoribosylaminoimidazole carboxylase/phosphoribosylaminoimidazole succinocarboxamide synthetase n=1 Tax=Lathamus discolor TaxID=678569 RepID=UPI0032B720D6
MESGAGKHWTEEEVKALLSVWSEKHIRKQLHGTLRNKGIFIYIAKRLQELGVCRDWKQCRAKYKNLKYEYRTVKYAHNSGDVTKTMKFFPDLDAILRYEPVTQLAAEENGVCPVTEAQLNMSPTAESTQGEISISLEDDEDALGDPLLFMSHVRPVQLGNPASAIEASETSTFIPTVANEGGKHWTVNEIRALIRIWSDKNIQQQLEGTVRNKRIFEQVAARLQKFGIDRDWKQCRTKYKNLKHEYKSIKSAQDSGSARKSMKFFKELDAILGHSTMEQASKSHNDESERPPEGTEAKSEKNSIEMPGDTGEEDSVSNMSEDLRVADIKKFSDSDDVTVNTTPENWAALRTTKETATTKILEDEGDFANSTPAALESTQIKKETIDIDDDSVSTTSEDRSCTPVAKWMVGTDSHIPLEEAQNHFKVITVNDAGAGKHWSDNEVKALINIWSDEKIQQMLEGATRNKEIFEEIARRLMKCGIDRDWKQCRTKYKNLKYEYRALQKENEHLGNPRRKMRFYDEVDCILRRQPLGPSGWGCESSSLLSVSVGDVTVNTGSLSIKRKTWNDEVSPVPLKKSASENAILHFQKLLTERVHTVTEGKKLLLERLCKQEEMQDLNRTQRYADPSAIQQFHECKTEIDLITHCNKKIPFSPCYSEQFKACWIPYKPARPRAAPSAGPARAAAGHALRSAEGMLPGLPAGAEPEEGTGRSGAGRPPAAPLASQPAPTAAGCTCRSGAPTTAGQPPRPGPLRSRRFGTATPSLPVPTPQPPPPLSYLCCSPTSPSVITWGTSSSVGHTPEAMQPNTPHSSRMPSSSSSMARPARGGAAPLDGPRPSPAAAAPARSRLRCAPLPVAWRGGLPRLHTGGPPRPWPRAHRTPEGEGSPSGGGRGHGTGRHWPGSGAGAVFARGGAGPAGARPRSSAGRRGARWAVSAAAPAAAAMAPAASDLKLGKKVNEGKTKEVFELPDMPGCVLMQSKDQITAGNAARKDRMEGKAAISNTTTSCVFQLLQESGIKTAFVRKQSDTAFIAAHCEMIPIEWVCRRIATGSFLKRNPGVKEGYKFYPPKIEMFYKDDAANDPQWSEEQIIEAKFCFAGLTIGQTEVDIMARSTQAIFEILEKSWQPQNCTLVDLKIEFGVNVLTKEIVLADVIDNDSWRLWPSGDRSQQKDKQSYRDLKEVTPEALQMVKRNFEWVAERVELLLKTKSQGRVVVLMGSPSDLSHCEKIKKACATFGIPCELRVTSAHKGPDETLRIKAEYEGDGIPTVFVAVAGRSNGLGPVMSGNTAYPVVNCPPLSADWGTQDVWSSLRLPSGLGCPTILSPEGAAQFAAQIFGLNNHLVWAKLRSNMLNTWISLKQADKKLRECTL